MGYFAFEHTYSTPEEFQDFVEACHQNNIGVLQTGSQVTIHRMTMLWPTSMVHQLSNIRIMIELITIVGGALNFDLEKVKFSLSLFQVLLLD